MKNKIPREHSNDSMSRLFDTIREWGNDYNEKFDMGLSDEELSELNGQREL